MARNKKNMKAKNTEMLTYLNNKIRTKPTNNYKKEEKLVVAVLKRAFGGAADFSIEDADLDRVYFSMDGHEYILRMWNICENKIDWTLYKCIEDHGEAITDGCYYFLVS